MIRQELWGVLLAYNLLCFAMAQRAYSLKGVEPNPLRFSQSYGFIIKELTLLPAVSPGKVPAVIRDMPAMAKAFVLPHRRERGYPRAVKRSPQKYPIKKNVRQLNGRALGYYNLFFYITKL